MIRGGKPTLTPGDEELGKKDDDHRFAPTRRSRGSTWNHSFRWRRRRVLLTVAGVFVVYLFFWSSAGTRDDLNGSQRYPQGRPLIPSAYGKYDRGSSVDDEPKGPPAGMPRPKHGEAPPRSYSGQIRFFRLARTLRPQASLTGGYAKRNRNVLFAMSNVKSASMLLPLICEMSTWKRNYVHAAFMGREDIPLEALLEINGVDKVNCPAVWHDARPDYLEYSSEARAESAVAGALSHINSFLHPQVAIMDDSLSEDLFFVRGMRSTTHLLDIPLIEVPKDRTDDFTWITRLDSGSLKKWHEPTVDILIQVPPDSSSVLRLLDSIQAADYSGLRPPRITLELPVSLDETVKEHLGHFRWPPNIDNPIAGSGLNIRRRIANQRVTQEESAIRFVELFYPASTTNSHVLLLSPQAQLSPLYFHFVKYALLEYRYSTFGQDDAANLMGLSLELPAVLLDGTKELVPPTIRDMHAERYKQLYPSTESAPFLWQAPNSHAAVFFGDKWAEMHSFISNRVAKHQQSPKSTSRPKLVSETFPSWTEYMLEFMRARSYSLLYPAITPNALVTIHNELYNAPEEFVSSPLESAEPVAPPGLSDEPFLRTEEAPRAPKNPEPAVVPGSLALHRALPFNGDLPEIAHVPQLLWNGSLSANVSGVATDYANKFREEVGGCTIPKGKHRKMVKGEASDLFCFGDEDGEDWEDDVAVSAMSATRVSRYLDRR